MNNLASGKRAWMGWAIGALLWFLPLNSPHLFDPDEGRYAEIPREMVASGDWVTPRLDGLKYFEKPALQYWTTALSYELFGEHAWTARLWAALSAFLGLCVTAAVGARLFGTRAGVLAAAVQGSALLYLGMARITTLDMSLTFGLELAMAALAAMVEQCDAPAATLASARDGRWFWPTVLGAGVAGAVLSKGLVGILIPGAVTVLFVLAYRDARLMLRAQLWWGLLVLTVLTAPWFVLVSLRNPGFAHFFFIVQHFQRYLSRAGFDRYQPAWFFIPVLLGGLLPWTSLLPGALGSAAGAARRGRHAAGLLLLWAGFVLLFFSASQSKLVPYILPAIPALCLLIGIELDRIAGGRLGRHLAWVAVGAGLIALAILVLWHLPVGQRLVAQASSPSIAWLIVAFSSLAMACVVASRLAVQARITAAVLCAALGSLMFTQAVLLGADGLPRMRRITTMTEQLRPWVRPDTRLYCVGDYAQPLPFYLHHTCTLVGYRGELDYGLTEEPQLGLRTLEQFSDAWRQPGSAAAVMRPADFSRLQELGVPMRVIYTAPSFVVVTRE